MSSLTPRVTPKLLNFVLKSTSILQKKIPVIVSLLITCFCTSANDAPPPLPIVAISQIVAHVSLDQEREGLLAALREAGYVDGQTVTIIYKNAQGNITTSSQIADAIVGSNPTVVVAISTPSAQTLMKPLEDHNIPLVFTAVTDPLEAKLVSSLDVGRPENVTGVTDALPMAPQLDLIQGLISIPEGKSALVIGVIYNPGEVNSVKAVEQLKKAALDKGITLEIVPATKSSDIDPAVTQLAGKSVDAIFIPNDNTAVAAMETIVAKGIKYQIPVFAGDAGSVERGAIAAQAYDRDVLGRKVGALVIKILKGEHPSDLVVEKDHPLMLMINLSSAKAMGVAIPAELEKQAKILGGGS